MKILEEVVEQFDEILEGVMGGQVPSNQYADNKTLSITKAYAIRPFITLSIQAFVPQGGPKNAKVFPIVSLSVTTGKEQKNIYSAEVEEPVIEGGTPEIYEDLEFIMKRYKNFI